MTVFTYIYATVIKNFNEKDDFSFVFLLHTVSTSDIIHSIVYGIFGGMNK